MKYKFIGTEQDLIDNGFNSNTTKSWFFKYKNGYDDICLTLFDFPLQHANARILMYNETDKPVKQKHIQDLIDKGLVEVIK